MALIRRWLPVSMAVLFGLTTLGGLLLYPPLSTTILGWAGVIAAVALVAGVTNLFMIHFRRTRQGNFYSMVLILGMLAVFAVALTDAAGFTNDLVDAIFYQVQAPLEAAFASLLAFFLLFAGVRLLQRERNVWSFVFLISALFLLFTQSPLPPELSSALAPIRSFVESVLVTSGIRGILLGVALGVITLSLRLLAGLERPYSQ